MVSLLFKECIVWCPYYSRNALYGVLIIQGMHRMVSLLFKECIVWCPYYSRNALYGVLIIQGMHCVVSFLFKESTNSIVEPHCSPTSTVSLLFKEPLESHLSLLFKEFILPVVYCSCCLISLLSCDLAPHLSD